mmetsp:Transcript_22051/g.64944  ORF Transcript_22051/g.64944 Transcript_22051/m.64944 type:complete len:284 (+) Transcript_22051:180-1031(+)
MKTSASSATRLFCRRSRVCTVVFPRMDSCSALPASSDSWLADRSRVCRAEGPLRSAAAALAAPSSSALHDRFRLVRAACLRAPSISRWPPSSPSRLSRRLRWRSDTLACSARPRYLPPSEWIRLSQRLSEISTDSPSSFASALAPRSAILLCERSRLVSVQFSARPPAMARTLASSSKLHGKARTESVSLILSAFASDEASLSFIPNAFFSYAMPMCLTAYANSRLPREGSERTSCSRSSGARTWPIFSVKTYSLQVASARCTSAASVKGPTASRNPARCRSK